MQSQDTGHRVKITEEATVATVAFGTPVSPVLCVDAPAMFLVLEVALRNLMVAKKRAQESSDKEIRGIFVLAADERNAAFWGPNNHYDSFKKYLEEVRGKYVPDVFRISVQDIVNSFSGSLSQYKEYFSVKYGFNLSR